MQVQKSNIKQNAIVCLIRISTFSNAPEIGSTRPLTNALWMIGATGGRIITKFVPIKPSNTCKMSSSVGVVIDQKKIALVNQ